MLLCRGISFVYEPVGYEKSWDFIIFKDGEPDINEKTVEESQEVIRFLNLGDATVTHCAIEDNTDGREYDVLLSCPPYGFKEIWQEGVMYHNEDYYIDLCIKKFKCKTMIFVVNETIRHKDFIVEGVKNISHMSKNAEKVVVIDLSNV